MQYFFSTINCVTLIKFFYLISACVLSNPLNSYYEFNENRIFNGETSEPGQFPYTVQLRITRPNSNSFCGGTILNEEWILTAAHCVQPTHLHIDIHLGAHSLNDINEEGRLIVRVQQVIIHPQYNHMLAANDIALLRLTERIVRFTDRIQSVNLPPSGNGNLFVNESVLASGWGRKYSGANNHASHLQWARLRVITNNECLQSLTPLWVRNTVICATGDNNESVCGGDSGGPLVLERDQRTIIGITSFGHRSGCDLGFPQGFTRITSYVTWIRSNTRITVQPIFKESGKIKSLRR